MWEPEGVLCATVCPRGHEENSVFSGQRHVSLDLGELGAARVTLHGAFNCASPVVVAFLCHPPRSRNNTILGSDAPKTHRPGGFYRMSFYISPPCAFFWAEA